MTNCFYFLIEPRVEAKITKEMTLWKVSEAKITRKMAWHYGACGIQKHEVCRLTLIPILTRIDNAHNK
jgi:hypothetical protein